MTPQADPARSDPSPPTTTTTFSRILMWVLWPAFLAACVLELLVFGFVDPEDMPWFGSGIAHSRQAVYAVAFIAFWLVAIAASAMTMLLSRTDAVPTRIHPS